MRKLVISIIFLNILVGCNQLNKSSTDKELDKVPVSLSIDKEKYKQRKWSNEIGTSEEIEDTKKSAGKGKDETVPTEFIYPRITKDVGSALVLPQYDAEMIDFTFNFKNADIKELIYKLLGEVLGLNYILDKRVAGTITLNTTGKIYKEELFPIVQSILSLNGFVIVNNNKLYQIVPLQDARQMPVDKIYSGDKIVKDGNDIITQVVPVNYLQPQEIIPTIRTFLTQGGTAVAPNDTHVVILVDNASNMNRLITILKTFDLPFFAGKAIKFYDIKNLDVKNLARHLESISASLGANTKGKQADLAFLPFDEANKMLVATKMPELFKTIELWIKNLDIEAKEGEVVRTYIYKMQHILADQVAPIITEVFKEEIEKIKKTSHSVAGKELKIIPAAGSNALIIRATQSDYYRIKNIIDELDATPQQVLIEVIIAEVKLNESLQYGVNFFIRDRFNTGSNEVQADGANPAPREISVKLSPVDPTTASISFLNQATGFSTLFSAIAGESTFEFLSTPHILVRDDQTATIQVGEDQPIVSGSTVSGDTVTENVQYRSVGIILTVTPHIGENGLVTLDITQEDSEVAGSGVRENPVFTTRRAETSLVVKDNNTILIGGIIETRDTLNRTKIPILGDIPFLGRLFKSKETRKDKTELLVLITPHVIDTANEAEQLSRQFEERLKAVEMLRKNES